jgi:hypothetical protein
MQGPRNAGESAYHRPTMTTPPVAQFSTDQASAEGDERAAAGGETVDVLVLTALQDELEAVLALGERWEERRDGSGFPYHVRTS